MSFEGDEIIMAHGKPKLIPVSVTGLLCLLNVRYSLAKIGLHLN